MELPQGNIFYDYYIAKRNGFQRQLYKMIGASTAGLIYPE